ncbi:putative HIT finger domain protein [Aspergillus undulatus]|uniref:putative HIT finger domain protein n=1 Tax=Aspergillus undulatus TaxID=1810928 RepID=UPI003CCD9642
MYSVEVLPNTSTSTATPGWTYAPIPAKGFDPSKAALSAPTGRKRGIRDPSRTDVSSRRTNAIARHIAELDRENHRDVAIPIPARKDGPRESATRGARTKVTSNVRRILQSQKTFRNYLDDEEAALAQAQAATGSSGVAAQQQRVALGKVVKPSRRSATPASTNKAGPSSSKSVKETPKQPDTNTTAEPFTQPPETEPQDQDQDTKDAEDANQYHLIKSEHDNDPLLRSYIPSAPSERIMRALLAEPPLSYNASRAGPPVTGRSARRFCCICGYWGKIRCRNCHQRTCGIECYKTHEDSRCGAFF